MKKQLYLECFSGISGDMTVAALLDLGADQEKLLALLKLLSVDGYEISISRVKKSGLDACDFHVLLKEQENGCREGSHHEHGKHEHGYGAHEHGYGDHEDGHGDHEHGHGAHEDEHGDHDHEHGAHEDEHGNHEHEHGEHEHGEHVHGAHEHKHGEPDHHDHESRNLYDIYRILKRIPDEKVRKLAARMFEIVAEAESKAHGTPVEQVHFHEVGAVDSIVDIVSAAFCIIDLDIEEVIIPEIYEGSGHVACQHGVLPVPVPATLHIAQAYRLNLHLTDADGELVTPTGAAIAAALCTKKTLPAHFRVQRTGIGAGKKEFAHANILRAMIIEEEEREDSVWVLETNIDDCSGEALGHAMEKLLEQGALDAYFIPAYMKKNRPAWLLQVICKEEDREKLERILFLHTTTIGVRHYPVRRTVMEREGRRIETPYGTAFFKEASYQGIRKIYPEYESVKKLCEEQNMDFQTMYHEILSYAEGRREIGTEPV